MRAFPWDLAAGVASVGAGAFCQNIRNTIILITYGIGWPSDAMDSSDVCEYVVSFFSETK